jgi:hypothetical protein
MRVIIPNGNFSAGILDEFVAGRWVKNKFDNLGLPNKTGARDGVLELSWSKFFEVSGNTLGAIDLAHGSSWANWGRGGMAAIPSISKGLMIAGNALGVVGIGIDAYQYKNNQISGLEFGVDTAVAGTAIVTSVLVSSVGAAFVGASIATAATFAAPAVAIGALAYFGGKAIYEYLVLIINFFRFSYFIF